MLKKKLFFINFELNKEFYTYGIFFLLFFGARAFHFMMALRYGQEEQSECTWVIQDALTGRWYIRTCIKKKKKYIKIYRYIETRGCVPQEIFHSLAVFQRAISRVRYYCFVVHPKRKSRWPGVTITMTKFCRNIKLVRILCILYLKKETIYMKKKLRPKISH